MDDRFLRDFAREPRPGFARALRERLRELDQHDPEPTGFRWHPALAAALVIAVVAGVFMVPTVRATARELLDLFRVRNLTAVPFDPARMERLKSLAEGGEEGSGPALFGFDTEVLRAPGEPRRFDTPQAAASAAGLSVREPADLPKGLALEGVVVTGDGEARMTVDTQQLASVLELLDLDDVQVPGEWDGRSLTVRMPRAVIMKYAKGERRVEFRQAASPEVDLPPGADLAQMGEVALRVLGLDAREARRTAQRIDWNGTLLVPVPVHASAFREVTIHGAKGLVIEMRPDATKRDRRGGLVLWTEEGRVYALGGNLQSGELVMMAESVR